MKKRVCTDHLYPDGNISGTMNTIMGFTAGFMLAFVVGLVIVALWKPDLAKCTLPSKAPVKLASSLSIAEGDTVEHEVRMTRLPYKVSGLPGRDKATSILHVAVDVQRANSLEIWGISEMSGIGNVAFDGIAVTDSFMGWGWHRNPLYNQRVHILSACWDNMESDVIYVRATNR